MSVNEEPTFSIVNCNFKWKNFHKNEKQNDNKDIPLNVYFRFYEINISDKTKNN